MKKAFAVIGCLLLVLSVYLIQSTVDSGAPEAVAKGQVYTGTVYVAGMGGHFAAADLEIDPSNTKEPIKVTGLSKVDIGNKNTHPTHDARVDVNDSTKMYWSTYKIDKEKGEAKRIMHVGLTDLKTGNVIKDVEVKLDDRAKWTGALYCGSGQTKTAFMPVTMSGEAYVDVFDKKDLKLKHRVFLDKQGYKNNYLFFHGVNSPDMKLFAIPINMTAKWPAPNQPGATLGKIDMVALDLAALEKGKVKVKAKNTISGDPAKTKTFRGTYTPDGKLLLQSGGDRMYVLDGKSMKLLDNAMPLAGENHDALATPDSKYAILTLREKVGGRTDGTLQLYDLANKKLVGKTSSVCIACHDNAGIPGNAVLCGLDVVWK